MTAETFAEEYLNTNCSVLQIRKQYSAPVLQHCACYWFI